MLSAREFADIDRFPGGRGFPLSHVLKDVPRQRLRSRLGIGPPGHIHLAKENHSAAFAIFQERTVLEAVPDVDDWQKIPANRLFDEDGGDVAAVAAAPKACDRKSAPVDGRSVSRAHFVLEARGKDGRAATPVAQM